MSLANKSGFVDFLDDVQDILDKIDKCLASLEEHPENDNDLKEIFRGLHTLKGSAGFFDLSDMVGICHAAESLLTRLLHQHLAVDSESLHVLSQAVGALIDMIRRLRHDKKPSPVSAKIIAHLTQLAQKNSMSVAAKREVSDILVDVDFPFAVRENGESSGLIPVVQAIVSSTVSDVILKKDAPTEQEDQEVLDKTLNETTLRINVAHLDQMFDFVGELCLIKNRLLAKQKNKDERENLYQQLGALVDDLKCLMVKTRMLPLQKIFQKYPRVVRDLSRQLGKQVSLRINGGEVELDKALLDDMTEPLVHLMRNAIDHGIESDGQRRALGKPSRAEIRLSAAQEGDSVLITFSDDGRGLNVEALKQEAVKKKFLSEKETSAMDDRQAHRLIFLPGLSTRGSVTAMSGRGFGMDIVKTTIERLHGTVEVISQKNVGTTIHMRLPLTLVIVPSLITDIPCHRVALPMSTVREVFPLELKRIKLVAGRPHYRLHKQNIPLHSLSSLLCKEEEKWPQVGVVLQSAEKFHALAVEAVVGQEDIIVKSLSPYHLPGLAGVATLSDGRIVGILNVHEMFSFYGNEMPERKIIEKLDQASALPQ